MARSLGNILQHVRKRLGEPDVAPLTDGRLLECFRHDHDETAFEALMQRHGPMVLAVCRRILRDGHESEDAFQATFLVLARKAHSISRRDSVGGWLHQVATHLALRVRAGSERRRRQERQVENMNDVPAEPSASHELRPVLDEELSRLPEKYRAPLVLCYFEGKTNEEAAQALSWPTGTVQGRLARARELLRQRLARRGLALSGTVLAELLAEETSRAAVPATLAQSTLTAAAQLAAGSAAAGLPAVALAERMVRTMFFNKLKLAGALAAVVGAIGIGTGWLLLRSPKPAAAADPRPDNPMLQFAKHYDPVKVQVQPRIPAYALPLDMSKVANFDQASRALGLTADEPSLKANGFAVLPGQGNEDIVAPYNDLKQREVPIFITADTLLHLYHVQFDETLKDIEEREFYPDSVALVETLLGQLAAQPLPVENEEFRQARHKALVYLAVALKSLKPEATLPSQVPAADVEQVLAKMKKHEGFWPNPLAAHQQWPLFRYAEDFSQYVPRGHYTRSEELKRYFVGLMWLGRMTFLLKGDPSYGPGAEPALVSSAEANQQTLAAALLTKALAQTVLPDKRKARDVWERIYAVTAFYVGLADDLGLPDYQSALDKVCGATLDLAKLADGNGLFQLCWDLARHKPPAIYSGTGGQSVNEEVVPNPGPADLAKALHKSMGFRFMGQRFVPDSYMMGRLVYPTVGKGTRKDVFTGGASSGGAIRVFPRGLDVMAVLGSRWARSLIAELGDDSYSGDGNAKSYDEVLEHLKKEYGSLGEKDWNRNLYWSWLHALKPLLADYGQGYQTFMTTEAYRTKSLNTALASWAQLRHDTILYAKQSYTIRCGGAPRLPKPVQGYVEPLPELYARLLTLARMTNRGLTQFKVLDQAAAKRLDAFEKLLERLLAIAEKELANKELVEADYDFIRNFGGHLQKVVIAPSERRIRALREEMRKLQQEQEARRKSGQQPNYTRYNQLADQLRQETDASMKTTLIADVHTDQNTQKVLEEGTGYVDLGVFVYRQPDGRLVLGAGPVLSYYEFKHPMKDRLTDEAWREMLKKGQATSPEWVRAYLSGKGRYVCR